MAKRRVEDNLKHSLHCIQTYRFKKCVKIYINFGINREKLSLFPVNK